jgi:hypothetical protein
MKQVEPYISFRAKSIRSDDKPILPVPLRKQFLPRYSSEAAFLKMSLFCQGIGLGQRMRYGSTCLHKNYQNQISIIYCKAPPTQGSVEHEKTIC